MNVEIIKCNPNTATCRVTHEGESIEFTVGGGTEAHQLLLLMVKNAIRTLTDSQAQQMMEDWRRR